MLVGAENDHPEGDSLVADAATCRNIARAAVALLKEATGRGPTYSKCFASEICIAVVFRGLLSPMESTSVENGNGAVVKEMRRSLFDANKDKLSEVVEREAGRRVEAVLYDISPEADASSFTFLLEGPAGDE